MKTWQRVGKQDVWALGGMRIRQLGPETFLVWRAQGQLDFGQRPLEPARFRKLKDAKEWGREKHEAG